MKYGFSIEEVASFLNISPSSLTKLENNEKSFTVSQLLLLYDLFGIESCTANSENNVISTIWYDKQDFDLKTTYKINRIIHNISFLTSLDDD